MSISVSMPFFKRTFNKNECKAMIAMYHNFNFRKQLSYRTTCILMKYVQERTQGSNYQTFPSISWHKIISA